jgi:hypothetical protein
MRRSADALLGRGLERLEDARCRWNRCASSASRSRASRLTCAVTEEQLSDRKSAVAAQVTLVERFMVGGSTTSVRWRRSWDMPWAVR